MERPISYLELRRPLLITSESPDIKPVNFMGRRITKIALFLGVIVLFYLFQKQVSAIYRNRQNKLEKSKPSSHSQAEADDIFLSSRQGIPLNEIEKKKFKKH